jgi:hypothetical protein
MQGVEKGVAEPGTRVACLLLYEADSADAVRAAAERAGVAFEHVAEAVESDGPET